MTFEAWITVGVLVATVIFLVRKPLPLEVISLGIPVVLFVTGVLDPRDALDGFGNLAVIALGSVFIVGAGLQEAGVTTLAARALHALGRGSELRLVLIVMAASATVSAFISNAATVAVLLPAVLALARRTDTSPSRLLMPLSFAAVLGGNLTQVGTASNIIVAAHSNERGAGPLGFFDFAHVGLPIVVAGIAWMALVGRRQLPAESRTDRSPRRQQPTDAANSYGLVKTLFRMRVVPKSGIRGRTIAESGLRARYGLQVVTVMRPRRVRRQFMTPTPDLVIASGDELYVEGSDEDAWRFCEAEVVQFGLAGPDEIERLLANGIAIAEVAIPPRSSAIGHSVKDLGLRTRHGVNVLSTWKHGAAVRAGFTEIPIEAGDAFLVTGRPDSIRRMGRGPDFIVLTDTSATEDVSRAPLALALLLLAVLPPVFDLAPLAVSGLAAAILMVATGCLPVTDAHSAVDWKVLFLIIGTVPLGKALETHGVSALAAEGLVGATGPLGVGATVAALFAAATLLAITTSNAAAAAILAPIASSVAVSAGIAPEKALLAVAHGCSCAFIFPFHQWNVLVISPGGYRSRDFLRVGAGVTLAVALTAVAFLTWT